MITQARGQAGGWRCGQGAHEGSDPQTKPVEPGRDAGAGKACVQHRMTSLREEGGTAPQGALGSCLSPRPRGLTRKGSTSDPVLFKGPFGCPFLCLTLPTGSGARHSTLTGPRVTGGPRRLGTLEQMSWLGRGCTVLAKVATGPGGGHWSWPGSERPGGVGHQGGRVSCSPQSSGPRTGRAPGGGETAAWPRVSPSPGRWLGPGAGLGLGGTAALTEPSLSTCTADAPDSLSGVGATLLGRMSSNNLHEPLLVSLSSTNQETETLTCKKGPGEPLRPPWPCLAGRAPLAIAPARRVQSCRAGGPGLVVTPGTGDSHLSTGPGAAPLKDWEFVLWGVCPVQSMGKAQPRTASDSGPVAGAPAERGWPGGEHRTSGWTVQARVREWQVHTEWPKGLRPHTPPTVTSNLHRATV